MLDSDASTAKTLTLVAIILQAVFFVIGIFEVIAVIALFSVTTNYPPTTLLSVSLGVIAIISIIFSVALLVGILWIVLDYILIYRKLAIGKVKEAETASIVLGIIQLIFGGFIPGILLIVAYVKIRDSVSRNNNATSQVPPQ